MAAQDWTASIAFTLAAEGGFVDDPNDPGGATNWGITLATLQHWRGPSVRVTVDDLRALTQEGATPIYRSLFWRVVDAGALPAGVDLMVFDMGVNAGPETSAQMLQRAVGATADGDVGPITLLAVKGADAAGLITSLSAAQLAYYQSCTGWPNFGEGWTNRLNDRTAHARAMLTGAEPPPLPKPTWLGQVEGWAARFL